MMLNEGKKIQQYRSHSNQYIYLQLLTLGHLSVLSSPQLSVTTMIYIKQQYFLYLTLGLAIKYLLYIHTNETPGDCM